MLLEKNDVVHGDLVVVAFSCPMKIICAVYGCWYRGAVPIPVKASSDGVAIVKCVAEQSKATFAITSSKKTYQMCFEKHIKMIEIGKTL